MQGLPVLFQQQNVTWPLLARPCRACRFGAWQQSLPERTTLILASEPRFEMKLGGQHRESEPMVEPEEIGFKV
jgi:hypothetical protein